MAMFSSLELNNLEDLFIEQIEDLYDAEKRLTSALPQMEKAATNPQLKDAFRTHLRETEGQINRLESIFRTLGRDPARETCEAMKGLIKEGSDVVSAKGDTSVKDAALIAAAQRVEHYEIAGYGTARTFAQRLGHTDAARLLQETLDEEAATDKKLTAIANDNVNVQAQRA